MGVVCVKGKCATPSLLINALACRKKEKSVLYVYKQNMQILMHLQNINGRQLHEDCFQLVLVCLQCSKDLMVGRSK